MVHLLGWVLQLDGADIRNVSKPLQISDKLFPWQESRYPATKKAGPWLTLLWVLDGRKWAD
jgi:hypothetical protein